MDLLVLLLLVPLVVLAVSFVAFVLVVLLGVRRAGRRNRVSPGTATPAPMSWLAAPHAGARLHRRLRAAVAAARAALDVAPASERLTELAAELEREAVVLDGQVVAVARLPARSRRDALAPLAEQVGRVERCASQISLMGAQARATFGPEGQRSALEELAHQLDLLEEARREVQDISTTTELRPTGPDPSGRATT